jgi:hypothetical protein
MHLHSQLSPLKINSLCFYYSIFRLYHLLVIAFSSYIIFLFEYFKVIAFSGFSIFRFYHFRVIASSGYIIVRICRKS